MGLDPDQAIESVLDHEEPILGLVGSMPHLRGLSPDAVLAHQPSQAMLANAVSLLDQGIPDAGTAIGLAGLSIDHPDA